MSFQERFYTGNDEEDAEIRQAIDELLEVAKYASEFFSHSNVILISFDAFF